MSAVNRFFPYNLVLPNMPIVAVKLMQSFANEDVSLGELADLIGQDPALSAKVLRLANSARYSPLRSVTSLREAAASLGLTMLRNLSLATSLSGAFPRTPGLEPERFWRHGLASAHYATVLARACMIDADTAYLGGLMLRTGQLLMAQYDKAGVSEIEQGAQRPGQRFALEAQRWQCTHTDVTAELARRWQFPDALLLAFRATAQPLQAQPWSALGAALRLAEALADAMDLELAPLESLTREFPELIQRLRLNPAWLADKLLDPSVLSQEVALMNAR